MRVQQLADVLQGRPVARRDALHECVEGLDQDLGIADLAERPGRVAEGFVLALEAAGAQALPYQA